MLSKGVSDGTGRKHFPEVYLPELQSTQILPSKTLRTRNKVKKIRRKKKSIFFDVFVLLSSLFNQS